MPFIDLIDRMGDAMQPTERAFTAIAEQLNASSAIYAQEIKSFQQAYRAEAFGVADLFGDVIAQSMCAIGVRAGALGADVDYRPHLQTPDLATRAIATGFDKSTRSDPSSWPPTHASRP